MDGYRKAVQNSADAYGMRLPPNLLDKFAAYMLTERDAPATYNGLESLLREFEHEDAATSKGTEDAPSYLDGGEREAPKRRKLTVESVSVSAMHNLHRIVVSEAAYHDRFYQSVGAEELPTGMHRTQESIQTALAALTDIGNGSDYAWLYHNLDSVRKVLRDAPSYLNRETNGPELDKARLDAIQAEFDALDFANF